MGLSKTEFDVPPFYAIIFSYLVKGKQSKVKHQKILDFLSYENLTSKIQNKDKCNVKH